MKLDEVGRVPLPAGAPENGDAHYKPAFAQLQAEIDKLSSLTAAGIIDWTRVVDLAGEVLSSISKDLSAAAYLGVGLAQTRGLEGLELGARILRDMAATFWETCSPPKKRRRGRMAAFAWWQEKILAWLTDGRAFDPLPPERFQTLREAVRALDETLGELLPDFPPMHDLLEALDRLPVEEPAAEEPEHTAAAQPGDETPPPPAAPEPAPARPAAPPEDAAAARRTLAGAAKDFAQAARAENPADPWPWLALRLGMWLNLSGLPPAEDGRTMLPPPELAVKNGLTNLLSQGRNLDAALAAEEQASASLFWLDPHRVAGCALAALGPEYAAAREAVCGAVRLLLVRLPGVEDLSFSDGTPFADAKTRDWLASLSAGGTGGGTASPAGENALAGPLAEAENRLARGDEAGALDFLMQEARAAAQGPVRLRLKLAQMDVLGRAGHWAVAAALAEDVAAEVERRGLADWDPDLAVEALLAARAAHNGLGGETGTARARACAERAARIKPSAALHLAG